jgi:hypothetical protein
VDTQLRKVICLITGSAMPTPLPWLPVLSHIVPPHIRREFALLKLVTRINKDVELPIHQYGIKTPRLKSRKPLLYRAEEFINYHTNNPNALQTEWHKNLPPNEELISCPQCHSLEWNSRVKYGSASIESVQNKDVATNS